MSKMFVIDGKGKGKETPSFIAQYRANMQEQRRLLKWQLARTLDRGLEVWLKDRLRLVEGDLANFKLRRTKVP
jgi:hypothetical protein